MISANKSIISEPKVLISGVEGAGKTLFAVQQADLLTREHGGMLYQLNIRGADPAHLPKLPFGIADMAYNEDGSPVLDPETGDHLPKWATLEPGSVIIVDEAHKVFPQRGPGRAPKHIEMLAEGRQFGIRFILMSQAPGSLDGFLRDRISRHYQLERKGNMERATVLEFDHCVMYPRTAWQERKDAQVHFWAYPKEYYGWYKSAKVHSFKKRIPWKIWAALLFVPLAAFVAWNVWSNVGAVMDGKTMLPGSDEAGNGTTGDAPRISERLKVETDMFDYLRQFQPVVATHPWSAPAFQAREVRAEPDLYCARSAAGVDAQGEWLEDSCSCLTEQGTRYVVARRDCDAIVDAGGVYNPFRQVASAAITRERDKPGEARLGPSGVRAPSPMSGGVVAGGGRGDVIAQYGQFRDEQPGPTEYGVRQW